VNILELARSTVAQLAAAWVGMPPQLNEAERVALLQDFIDISRYCFLPHAPGWLEKQASAAGARLKQAYAQPFPSALGTFLSSATSGYPFSNDPRQVATALIGAIVGFAAPAVSNIVSVLSRGLMNGELERVSGSGGMDEQQAHALVQAAMLQAPMPPVLYRTVQSGPQKGRKIVIGLQSACASAPAGEDPLQWIFGGQRAPASKSTVHGCPARHQGMSAIVGVVAAVLACPNLKAEGPFEFSFAVPASTDAIAASDHPLRSRAARVAPAPVLHASACPMHRKTEAAPPDAGDARPSPA
jgi:hypothetical protein